MKQLLWLFLLLCVAGCLEARSLEDIAIAPGLTGTLPNADGAPIDTLIFAAFSVASEIELIGPDGEVQITQLAVDPRLDNVFRPNALLDENTEYSVLQGENLLATFTTSDALAAAPEVPEITSVIVRGNNNGQVSYAVDRGETPFLLVNGTGGDDLESITNFELLTDRSIVELFGQGERTDTFQSMNLAGAVSASVSNTETVGGCAQAPSSLWALFALCLLWRTRRRPLQ